MNRYVVVLLIIAVLVGLANLQPVSAVPTYDVEYNMAVFAPTRIVVQFTYSSNFSGPLNMTTLSGFSLWTATISPITFEFNAKDVDYYTFDVHLAYNSSVDQVIQLSYWSGNLNPSSINYHVVGKEIWLHFYLTVLTQPVIPTKEEIAEQVVIQVKQDLADYMAQVGVLTNSFSESMFILYALIAVSIIVCFIALIIGFYAIRSSHQPGRR